MKVERIAVPLVSLLALVAAIKTQAEEAYVDQVSVAGISVSLPEIPAGPRGSVDLAGALAVGRPSGNLSAPRIFDGTARRLLPGAMSGALGRIASTGDGNSALLLQAGSNSASIRQNGDDNLSVLMQAGSGNRASIFQSGNGRRGAILQRGRGNSAILVQN